MSKRALAQIREQNSVEVARVVYDDQPGALEAFPELRRIVFIANARASSSPVQRLVADLPGRAPTCVALG